MLGSTAAFLVRVVFLVVWLSLDACGFRLVRARNGHGAASSSRTVGAALLACHRCSVVRVSVTAHDDRSAPRLLYVAAVWNSGHEQERLQGQLGTDPPFVSYRHSVGCRRWPGHQPLPLSIRVGRCSISLWSDMVVRFSGHQLTRDRLLRRSFRVGVNLRMPRSDAVRDAPGRPLGKASFRLFWNGRGTDARVRDGCQLAAL